MAEAETMTTAPRRPGKPTLFAKICQFARLGFEPAIFWFSFMFLVTLPLCQRAMV
jgi:hypothetical protein